MAVANEYLENDVMTASPHRLHLLVVDAAMKFARHGVIALEEHRWEDLGTSLTRARECLTELIGGIQPDHAPELAEGQRALFFFVYRNFVVAELQRDRQQIEDGLKLLQIHRETWVELGIQLHSVPAAPSGQSGPRVPQPHLSASRSWVT